MSSDKDDSLSSSDLSSSDEFSEEEEEETDLDARFDALLKCANDNKKILKKLKKLEDQHTQKLNKLTKATIKHGFKVLRNLEQVIKQVLEAKKHIKGLRTDAKNGYAQMLNFLILKKKKKIKKKKIMKKKKKKTNKNFDDRTKKS